MKTRKSLEFYIRRAIDDFKTLVIYFNITRPQYENDYKEDGKFSIGKLTRIKRFLSMGTSRLSRNDLKSYNQRLKKYNYTFGIPNDLVRRVIGKYVDYNGRHVRISTKKIVQFLVDKNFIEPIGNGVKVRKDSEGNYKAVCRWGKKYLLKDVKYAHALFNDKRYCDINTFPNASERIRRIIMEWVKGFDNKRQHKDNATPEQSTIVETPTNAQIQPDYFQNWLNNREKEKSR